MERGASGLSSQTGMVPSGVYTVFYRPLGLYFYTLVHLIRINAIMLVELCLLWQQDFKERPGYPERKK